jgi:site-specific DNA-methyltransferase (adenine-specific)
MIHLEPGDCLNVVPRLVAEGVVVDSIVCDPPYHLVAIADRSKYKIKHGRDGAMKRLLSGFMGTSWDGGDIAFRPETWATMATILRPGGFLLAFGGTRTWHRLACAIEDAGFVIQDTLMWLYGSGFPKRRDMLKPAWEPIIMAYKPAGKRTLQIEECRIPTDGADREKHLAGWNRLQSKNQSEIATYLRPKEQIHLGAYAKEGRWPANVCHDGSDEVMEAFAAFGDRSSGVLKAGTLRSPDNERHCYGKFPGIAALADFGGDTGSVARFFYCAKADAQDRWGSRHPTVKPAELMKWLVPLVTPRAPAIVLDPFAGSGTTGVAALATGRNAILIEREPQYQSDIRERIAHYKGEGRHSMVVKNRHKPSGIGALRDGGQLATSTEARGTLPLFGINENENDNPKVLRGGRVLRP